MIYRYLSIVAAFALCIYSSSAYASRTGVAVIYTYPLTGATSVPVESGLGFRFREPLPTASSAPIDVQVVGSLSGPVLCTWHLTSDHSMLIVVPGHVFRLGEVVTAQVQISGTEHPYTFTTHFSTTTATIVVDPSQHWRTMSGLSDAAPLADSGVRTGLPPIRVIKDIDPSEGSLFLCNFGFGKIPNGSNLLVLDKHGVIQVSRPLASGGSDFKVQPNGLLTYCDFGQFKYYGLDARMNVVDSFGTVNGYVPDLHELICLQDGGYIILGASYTPLYLGDYGLSRTDTAVLLGNVIQEFDKDRNLIFEWRGIDHYNLMDAIHIDWHDTSLHQLDFEHANAIDTDRDGNLILSNRHMDEITKIDRKTGDVLWRMGGRNNQFTFTNDTVRFTYQHAVRILPNGHMTLFDNGNYHSVPESRAVEYSVDEAARTVTQVWEFRHDPPVYGFAMGYVQRLENGNTLVSWGASNTTATEVSPTGSVVFDMAMDSGNYSYRVFKFNSPLRVGGSRRSGSAFGVSYNTERGELWVTDATRPVTVTLYDLLGRSFVTTTYSESSENLHVPLSGRGLPPGYYRVAVSDGVATESIGIAYAN